MASSESDQTELNSLEDVIDHWAETARESGESVSLRDLMKALDRSTFGPLLLIPSLISVSPVGAIPGMSILTASLIILIAGQAFLRNYVWLPSRLLDFSFDAERLHQGAEKARPWVRRVERFVYPRLDFMVDAPLFQVSAVAAVALALSFYPLALIPMGVFVPSAAIAAIAIGWTVRDGVMVSLGLATGCGSFALLIVFWPL